MTCVLAYNILDADGKSVASANRKCTLTSTAKVEFDQNILKDVAAWQQKLLIYIRWLSLSKMKTKDIGGYQQ